MQELSITRLAKQDELEKSKVNGQSLGQCFVRWKPEDKYAAWRDLYSRRQCDKFDIGSKSLKPGESVRGRSGDIQEIECELKYQRHRLSYRATN